MNFTARAELCTPRYVTATLPVTAVINYGTSRVFFDEAEFSRRQQPVPAELLDLDRLNDLTFGPTWIKYISAPAGITDIQGFEGLSMLLAKTYSFEMKSLLRNSSLPERASRLRSRFFTELVHSSVLDADVPTVEDIAGTRIKAEDRIVVVPGVSITLAVLLLLAACYPLAMLWYASSRHRPLNLDSNPAALAGIVPLTNVSSSLAASLRTWTHHDRRAIQNEVGSQVYVLHDGMLRLQGPDGKGISSEISVVPEAEEEFSKPGKKSAGPSRTDWRPSMLRKTWLACLLLCIIAIAVVLIILRDFA